ncbi:MAG: T9SS type A sorting domain-containing protein, partial [Chitinophagaceae bacterium]|nr:T9SS type A sorting domain-containing protein [Chitinophagaceae bacterium]
AISNTTTAMSGDYIVTIDSNGCLNKDTVTVLIKPLPTPVTASSNTPVCAGDTLKVFSTASSTGATYTWIGPGSYSANTQNSSRANAASNMTGWYKITVTLNGCTTLDSTYATVTAIPSAPSITFNNPLCTGETLHLQASSVSGATYSWTGPGSFTAAVQNPDRNAMQFGDTGTYKATATVNGCVSPEGSITVHINPVPFVVILANPADSICQGDPVVFTALPNNYGGTPNYQWKVNAQSKGTGSTFNTSTLNNGDVILCEMTEHTKCSAPYKDESNDITMTVLPWLAPSVTISANPTHPLDEYEYVTFTAVTTNAGNNPQYQWKRNGKDVLGAKSYKWSANTLSDNDSISVEIISDYKCPQPTNAVSNYVRVKMTGVKDIAGIGNVVLYPNPNNGKFVIEINGLTSRSIDIEVVNTLGQVVYMDNVQAVNGTIHQEADLHNAVPGVYLLRLKDDNGYMTTIRFRVE